MLSVKHAFTADDPLELIYQQLTQAPLPLQSLPEVLIVIVNKLIEKNPENRYQTLHTLKHDLEYCLKELKENGAISYFTIAEHDVSARFEVSYFTVYVYCFYHRRYLMDILWYF